MVLIIRLDVSWRRRAVELLQLASASSQVFATAVAVAAICFFVLNGHQGLAIVACVCSLELVVSASWAGVIEQPVEHCDNQPRTAPDANLIVLCCSMIAH
eukprot:973491-Amphidinium_carterae.1